ncbi:MAG: hypothetical protein AAGH41_12460 [Pseudomonadota bacterium]
MMIRPLLTPSSQKAKGLCGTRGRTVSHVGLASPWVPALRCAAAGMTVALSACGWGDEIQEFASQYDCIDYGGVWDEDAETCFCSTEQQGTYKDNPSANQIAWREWCAGLSNLDSIKNKAAVTPAPSGE